MYFTNYEYKQERQAKHTSKQRGIKLDKCTFIDTLSGNDSIEIGGETCNYNNNKQVNNPTW
jgi:hypothetical protein